MGGHYEALLEDAIEGSWKRIGELRMMSEIEEMQIVREWNDGERGEVGVERVEEMVRRQAEDRGECIAIVKGEEEITYEELDRRGEQLGRYLRKLGVGAETVVGVCTGRGIEM